MNDTVICIEAASASAGGCVLVDMLTLSVQRGERIAIVGQNGAGKSSLLKLIAGSLQPANGRVEVLGQTLHEARSGTARRWLQSQTGQIFQGLHLVQRLSALDNVLLGSLGRNRSWRTWLRLFPDADVLRARNALATVGLSTKADVRVDRLSGGERQKVAIARALLQDPQLLLADEPTAALDPAASTDIATTLAAIAIAQRITMVSVLHDVALLGVLADRVIGLRRGRLVFDLPVGRVDAALLSKLYDDAGLPGDHHDVADAVHTLRGLIV